MRPLPGMGKPLIRRGVVYVYANGPTNLFVNWWRTTMKTASTKGSVHPRDCGHRAKRCMKTKAAASVAAGVRRPHHAPIRQGHWPPIMGLHPAPPPRRWPSPGARIVRGELPAAREGESPPLRVRGRQGRPAHGGRRQHHFHSLGSTEGQAGFFQERAPHPQSCRHGLASGSRRTTFSRVTHRHHIARSLRPLCCHAHGQCQHK